MIHLPHACCLLLIAFALGGTELLKPATVALTAPGVVGASARPAQARPARQVSSGRRDAPSAQPQSQGQLPGCEKGAERANISGQVKGLLYPAKGAERIPATLSFEGEEFTLAYSGTVTKGKVAAFNQCDVTYISLLFEDSNLQAIRAAGTPAAWLIVRETGSSGKVQLGRLETLSKPIILQTISEKDGTTAGPDFAFVGCPKHPDCLDWPICPCNP